MNLKLRYLLTPVLLGAITVSCDQKESDAIAPDGFTAESSGLATSANLLYEETFEGSNPFSTAHSVEVGSWAHALQYTSPAFQGAKAARFELRESDPLVKNGTRAEVTIVKGSEGHITKNAWYSFAAYFPADGFVKEEDTDLINQWHQDGDPSASIRIKNDRFQFRVGSTKDNRQTIDLGQVTKDTWHEFVLHFVHSPGSDGLVEIWHNGKKIYTHNGGNMYDNGILPKWKIGIYKDTWNEEATTTPKRVLYYDNVRVGGANATLADMTSGGATAPTTFND